MAAISIRNLGKRYQLGLETHNTLRDHLTALFRRGPRNGEQEFWALRDVSFDVQQGDVVGIVGRNGAGKSTLLKVLSQITDPSEGEVRIRGRVASLLEVGTGFHPELSGRENVFLNGAILGMSQREIRTKFDEIVAFAEVEKFIDTPVKHYSSGMYVRLAFAVAAHLEPEILIVDEVLAVGDGAFQRKCIGKMGEVSKSGRTVLFVSHNLTAVRTLCRSAVLLASGRLVESGSAEAIVHRYVTEGEGGTVAQWEAEDRTQAKDAIRIMGARLVPRSSDGVIDTTAPLDVTFEVWNGREAAVLNMSMSLQTEDDVIAFATVSPRQPYSAGLIRATCQIPGNFLNNLLYRVSVMVVEDGRPVEERRGLLAFEVAEGRTDRRWFGKWPGAIRPTFTWETVLESTAT